MSNMLGTQDVRSRLALLQELQRGSGKPVNGVAEGVANAGTQILNALIAKQLMDKEDRKDFTKEAAARALNTGMGEVSGVDKIGFGRTPEGGVDINAPTTTETVRPTGPAMNQNTQDRFMDTAIGPEQALMMRLQKQQAANAPYNLAPGERRFSGDKQIGYNPAAPKQPEVSGLSRMMAERDALPQGDPRRATYDAAIKKDTYIAPQAQPSTPTSKFAFDRKQNKNVSVTDQQMNAEPDRYAPPVTAPQVKLFNKSGQEVATGDPNDPEVQRRIQSGEVRTAPPRQFSGEQSKASAMANDAISSEANFEKLMNPQPDKDGKVAKKFDPTGGMDSWALTNWSSSPELQQYEQAMSNWGQAVLRQESGGAITPVEGLEYARTFFPRFGDSAQVVAQKKAQRDEKVKGMIAASGGAYEANFGAGASKPDDGGWSAKLVAGP